MPTTPFLLLAVACFAKSSEKLYNLIINSKLFGKYIKNYREKRGIPLRGKIIAISSMWISISYVNIFTAISLWLKILFCITALAVTIHILSFKTLK
jgi:hypothetical protein